MSLADAFRQRGRDLMGAPGYAIEPSTKAPERRGGGSERRDPTAATQIVGHWQSPSQPMIAEWSAEEAFRWAYCANVIAYRCIQILANDVAGCTFRAGAQAPTEPGGKAPDNPNARLAQLLGPPPGGPAPKLTARRLWTWIIVQRIVSGRHGVEIELDPATKEVTALWPLVSAHIYPYPSAGGTDWFRTFDYGTGDQAKSLPPDRILYGWDPSPSDFRQPMSCFQAARLDLTIVNLMDRYNIGFLRNDARPAALVVTEAFASDNDHQAFKSNWNGEYGGPDNRGKTAFLETPDPEDDGQRIKPAEAVYIKELGLSQTDAMFVEQHKESLSRVAMAVGVPWSRLDSSGRTFNNAGQEDRNYWFDRVLPLTSDLADEVNMQLAPRLGPEVGWFDLSHVPAFQDRADVKPSDVKNLLLSRTARVNEARGFVGLGPVDGGDRFLSDDEIAVITGRTPATPPLGETTPSADLATPDATLAENTTLAVPEPEVRAIPASPEPAPDQQRDHRGETPEQARERRVALWHSTDAAIRTLESRWETEMVRLFNRQEKATIARLEGNRGRRVIERRASADDVFAKDFWTDETRDVADSLYELVVASAAGNLSHRLGVSFDVADPWAQKLIKARSNMLAGQVTDTTYQAITDAIAAGVDAGEAIPKIAERIRHVFDVATKARSTTIARTEVVSAYAGSTRAAADSAPVDVVGGYEWLTAPGATHPRHEGYDGLDGQTIERGATFDVGGARLAYPGDPSGPADETINCRCAMAAVTPDQMPDGAGRSRRVLLTRAIDALELVQLTPSFDDRAMRRLLVDPAPPVPGRAIQRPSPAVDVAGPPPAVAQETTVRVLVGQALRRRIVHRDEDGLVTHIEEVEA